MGITAGHPLDLPHPEFVRLRIVGKTKRRGIHPDKGQYLFRKIQGILLTGIAPQRLSDEHRCRDTFLTEDGIQICGDMVK
jgi:hypothetical protein